MGGYGQPSLQSSHTPTATEIPAAVVLPFVYLDGPLSGELKITADVPILNSSGGPLTVPVLQMTLFYSLTDLSTYDTDELFALPDVQVGRQTVAPAISDTDVTFDITGLAPGVGYSFRCAAST